MRNFSDQNWGLSRDYRHWLISKKSPNTRKAYARDLEHVAIFFADRFDLDLFAAAPSHVDAYREVLTLEGMKTSTINRRLSALSSFYTWAVRENIVDLARNPASVDYVERGTVTVDHAAALNAQETRNLFAAARTAGPRDLLTVLILAYTGIRVSELINAKATDLRTERGHCTLTVLGKGSRRRRVALPLEACEMVEDLGADAWLINNDGEQLNRHQITRILARLQKAAGIETVITSHVLRATMITEALAEGVDLWIVQDTAGHSDPRTTRGYQRRAATLDQAPTYALANRWAS